MHRLNKSGEKALPCLKLLFIFYIHWVYFLSLYRLFVPSISFLIHCYHIRGSFPYIWQTKTDHRAGACIITPKICTDASIWTSITNSIEFIIFCLAEYADIHSLLLFHFPNNLVKCDRMSGFNSITHFSLIDFFSASFAESSNMLPRDYVSNTFKT